MNTRHLDAFMEDTSSVTWDAKNALEELKEEEYNIRETLAKLQSRKEEINADKTNIRQRLHQKEKEEMECLVQSYRTELSQLKGELEQINESLKQMVQEEKCQREMGFADKEAIEDAQKAIDEFCEDMDQLEEELKHARKEEEKIGNELKGSSLSLVNVQYKRCRYLFRMHYLTIDTTLTFK
jgi:chromosome segregation ATPase